MCVPKGSIYNKSVVVHVMAWRRIGDKPSSEPMMAYSSYIGLNALRCVSGIPLPQAPASRLVQPLRPSQVALLSVPGRPNPVVVFTP